MNQLSPAPPVDVITAADAEILKQVSALLLKMSNEWVGDDDDDVENPFDDMHLEHVWVGVLIGSGACTSLKQAYAWAIWVRYNTDDLFA